VQFPYAFTNTGAHRYYLARVCDAFKGYAVHVELRHESWNTHDLFGLLEQHASAPVSADLPRVRQFMPFITRTSSGKARLSATCPPEFIERRREHVGGQAYLRLHGRNEKGWLLNTYDYRYDYLYNSRELTEIRKRIMAIPESCERIVVVWNNTPGGKALANALHLLALLHNSNGIPIPEATRRAFPHLEQFSQHSEPATLFDGDQYRRAM
jgi:uncharacterized protein YecE (DUF72 family)